jgi:aldehyde dehydrogenase (NAD+)
LPEKGYYIAPTIIVDIPVNHSFSHTEIFGPVVSIYRVNDIEEALQLANNSEYGLTSAIHTKDIDRAMWFVKRVRSGVTNINMGTMEVSHICLLEDLVYLEMAPVSPGKKLSQCIQN